MTLPHITCPSCAHSFEPELPEKPATPPEWEQQQPTTPAIAARIMLTQGMLANLRDSLARQFGFVTQLTTHQDARTWTLTVSVPEPKALPDDATLP